MILESPQQLLAYQQKNSRLLGLDVGTKTIGLAVSDTGWMIASPLRTVHRRKFTVDVQDLIAIVNEFSVRGLVLGWPRHMNGDEGIRCQSTRQFAHNIIAKGLPPVCFWDERLSTIAVTRTLLAADVSRKRRAEVVDKMAASFILQGVLDYLVSFKTRTIQTTVQKPETSLESFISSPDA